MVREFKEHFPSREKTDISLARFTSEKSGVTSIPLTYLKTLILPVNLIIASPGGMVVPYEAGYALLALMEKDWVNEKATVAAIIDKFNTLQNADGSWYQQYYPWGAFTRYEDRKVDSGAALLAWSMADYDARNATITYKTAFRKAVDFLYSLRWELASYYEGPTLRYKCVLKNQVINGVKEEVAFAADVAEAILALIRGLQTYGDPLTTDPGGYDVKTFTRELVEGLDTYMWVAANDWYQTEYPLGAQSESSPGVYITFEQLISYTQALCAWALKQWDNTYGTPGAHDANSKKALDRTIANNMGRWGGFLYHGTWNYTDPEEEYPHYAALMRIAMNKLDPTRYSKWIARTLDFMRKASLSDGQVADRVLPDGLAYVNPEARGPLALTVASCILAGA